MNYDDCKECKFDFGQKECLKCEYYNDCMVENEIDEFERNHDRELESYLDRLENGEIL